MKMVLVPDPDTPAGRVAELLSESMRRNVLTFCTRLEEGEYLMHGKPGAERLLWHSGPWLHYFVDALCVALISGNAAAHICLWQGLDPHSGSGGFQQRYLSLSLLQRESWAQHSCRLGFLTRRLWLEG